MTTWPPEITEAARAAADRAKAQWLAAHPEPEPRDVRCPRCKAQPDEPCRSPHARKVERSHAQRQDLMIRARHKRIVEAARVWDRAYDHYLRYGPRP